MRVLVTNDDGVEAPGIRALVVAIHDAGHDVVVVAPSGERSGSGAATGRIHRSGPIPWTTVEWSEVPDVAVHSVDLPPAAAVYAGLLGAFGPRPDVVASGVNHGLNYGHLALHSGTVGAALTASALGVPGVAVSLAWGDAEQHWATAAAMGAAALDAVAAEPALVVNVNVPNLAADDLAGVGAAVPAPYGERWSATTRPGELLLTYEGRDDDADPGTDVALVRAGFVAVTILTGLASGDAAAASATVAEALATRVGA